MSRFGELDLKQFKKWANQIQAMSQAQVDSVYQDASNRVARQLLAEVKKRTPVGVPPADIDAETFAAYWSGYTGGTLRRTWRAAAPYKAGNAWTVEITNNTEYASYVEYGHRQHRGQYVPALGKSLKVGWVPGRHMLTLSIQAVQPRADKVLSRALRRYLEAGANGR